MHRVHCMQHCSVFTATSCGTFKASAAAGGLMCRVLPALSLLLLLLRLASCARACLVLMPPHARGHQRRRRVRCRRRGAQGTGRGTRINTRAREVKRSQIQVRLCSASCKSASTSASVQRTAQQRACKYLIQSAAHLPTHCTSTDTWQAAAGGGTESLRLAFSLEVDIRQPADHPSVSMRRVLHRLRVASARTERRTGPALSCGDPSELAAAVSIPVGPDPGSLQQGARAHQQRVRRLKRICSSPKHNGAAIPFVLTNPDANLPLTLLENPAYEELLPGLPACVHLCHKIGLKWEDPATRAPVSTYADPVVTGAAARPAASASARPEHGNADTGPGPTAAASPGRRRSSKRHKSRAERQALAPKRQPSDQPDAQLQSPHNPVTAQQGGEGPPVTQPARQHAQPGEGATQSFDCNTESAQPRETLADLDPLAALAANAAGRAPVRGEAARTDSAVRAESSPRRSKQAQGGSTAAAAAPTTGKKVARSRSRSKHARAPSAPAELRSERAQHADVDFLCPLDHRQVVRMVSGFQRHESATLDLASMPTLPPQNTWTLQTLPRRGPSSLRRAPGSGVHAGTQRKVYRAA